MNSYQKLFARKMFMLRVHQAKGTEFQSLFERIMSYRYASFIQVRPYGSDGDRKNDGYDRDSGTFYQVYAPVSPEGNRTEVSAATKAKDDFGGLIDHWEGKTAINHYRFVFNDEYRGSPAKLEAALLEIESDNNVTARAFLARDLENEAMSLPEDQLLEVIHTPIPSPEILDSVDYGVLSEVVNHILAMQTPVPDKPSLNAPAFDEKIKFNGLTNNVGALLTVASYQSDAITDFFSKNSDYAKQRLRDRLATVYSESVVELQNHPVMNSGDDIFFKILKQITPATQSPQQSKAAQDAALVVMAFYFEACDIFEEPDATS